VATSLSMRTFGIAQCAECLTEFTKRSPIARYCGEVCKATARNANVSRRLARRRAFEGPKSHARVCRRCEVGFETTDPYNYYCQPCIAAAENSGRSKYQFLSRKAKAIPAKGECGICKSEFDPTWVTQRYCGASCRQAAKRQSPEGLLNSRMTCAVRRALRGGKNGRPWERLVGYTAEELRRHIERQFLPGMTWADAGKFHIDHIRPLASFHFDSAEHPDFRAAWALTNLRPMWAADNISKGAKLTLLL